MASKFCFTVTCCQSNKEARFLSSNGDEYEVSYNSNNRRDLILHVSWKFISNVLVMAEVYTKDLRNCVSSKGKVVTINRTILTLLGVFSSCDNDYTCLISVIPYVPFPNFTSSTNSSLNQILPAKPWPATENKLEKLSLDMQNLLTRNDLSDVVVTDGTTEIKAHKLVLSARSPVFDKMFQHDFIENLENRLIISDISADVLNQMIRYIYTGVVTINDIEMAQDLYVAADKYDIQDLKPVCTSLIKKDMALDNVLYILVFASLTVDSDLKKSAMEFIVENFLGLKNHESWDIFVKEHNELVMEILSFAMEKRL